MLFEIISIKMRIIFLIFVMKMSKGMRKKRGALKHIYSISRQRSTNCDSCLENIYKKNVRLLFSFGKQKKTRKKTEKMKIYGKIPFFFLFIEILTELQRFEIYSIRDHKVHLR